MPVRAPLYPVGLVVDGRRCLVVGGGRIAARKVEGLRSCGAIVHVVAPSVSDEIKAMTGVTYDERPYERADLDAMRLVITATGDPAVDQQIFDECEAAGIWCNSADDPDRCTFTLPATLRHGPLLVTVSTGGHSPALATWLRDRIRDRVGPEYEILLEMLSDARGALQAAGVSTEGLDWHKALDSEMLELIRAGLITEARERLRSCLSSS
ncbi:MAG TPA: bifunctional precorrin-2 dehydrogenase/sirohydrochlorin ferrochelatase [Acidimicrobiales bacterium]|nr:bifunctional precorrin-2 dehydrogenase/sirohydrochlorin ferrochelatase [Acidimicrobiales bacterium]